MSSAPTGEQLYCLWAFARGDMAPKAFESWFLEQAGLEAALGADFHWDLTSSIYDDREEVWRLRSLLLPALAPLKTCECPTLCDLDHVPMGGDFDADNKFRSDHVFETIDEVAGFGPPKWWLWIGQCRVCSTTWLIAQDDRIYDEWFLARVAPSTLVEARGGRWPANFLTYENVLATGAALCTQWVFLDANDSSLIETAQDLVRERPDISAAEIGYLMGLSEPQASELLKKVA